MDNNISLIRNFKVAYRIGFYSGLNQGSWNAYFEMKKWEFNKEDRRRLIRLHKRFIEGFNEAKQIRRSILVAGVCGSD